MNITKKQLDGLYRTGVKALAGDSNDAEHDALFSITEDIGSLIGRDVHADRDRMEVED